MKLGKPINIDPARARSGVRNRIHRVGIELEGGWERLPSGASLVGDSSVRIPEAQTNPNIRTGELPSPPRDISTWREWVTTHYPPYVNDTCGMHVHMSFFNALTYQRLMTPSYAATIVEEFKKWAKRESLPSSHPIWSRLADKSPYCRHLFHADDQVTRREKDHSQTRPGHRYTIINYCYGRYNTLECRLLPMMATPDLAIRAIQELIDITNAFLVTSPKKEKREIVEVPLDTTSIREESRINA